MTIWIILLLIIRLSTPSPTYNFCVENKLFPTYVLDIAISHKGSIAYGIEIVNTNKISSNKKLKIQDSFREHTIRDIKVLEISA